MAAGIGYLKALVERLWFETSGHGHVLTLSTFKECQSWKTGKVVQHRLVKYEQTRSTARQSTVLTSVTILRFHLKGHTLGCCS